jgi:hypothetical protein
MEYVAEPCLCRGRRGRLEAGRGERRRDVGSEIAARNSCGKGSSIRHRWGVARDGGGRWAAAAARCLRNPSERKHEKILTYCREREIEERYDQSIFVEIGPPSAA